MKRGRLRHSKPLGEDQFTRDVLSVYDELELWRSEIIFAAKSAPDEFPPFNRKAGIQALFFFVAFVAGSVLTAFAQRTGSRPAMSFAALAAFLSAAAGPILFVFEALGLAKAAFWRALVKLFVSPKGTYPFTGLRARASSDLLERRRLRKFQTGVLRTVLDRIEQEHAELKERLDLHFGSPTIFVTFGLATGAVTAWQNYYAHPNSIVSASLFVGTVAMLAMGVRGAKLRDSLAELTRCRALLSLELAGRDHVSVDPGVGDAAIRG